MNQFNNLMDDLKASILMVGRNKKVLLPAIIANIALVIIGIVSVIVIIAGVVGTIIPMVNNIDDSFGAFLIGFLPLIIGIFVLSFIISIFFIALDIGISGMVIGVANDETPSASLFFDAVKKHLLSVVFTKLGFGILVLLTMVIWIIPYLLYTLTVGILTGGWGLLFLSLATRALIGFWVLIKVEDNRGGWNSIARNVKFGKSHLMILVLIFYISTSIAGYAPALLSLLGALIAVFIGYALDTYFKFVVLMTYRRYREE